MSTADISTPKKKWLGRIITRYTRELLGTNCSLCTTEMNSRCDHTEHESPERSEQKRIKKTFKIKFDESVHFKVKYPPSEVNQYHCLGVIPQINSSGNNDISRAALISATFVWWGPRAISYEILKWMCYINSFPVFHCLNCWWTKDPVCWG